MKDRFVPDEQLIQGCIEGKREAQNQLYSRYARRMFGVCLRYTPDAETAEDVLQDGFVKVFLNIGSYKGTGSFEGWIRRIMVNTALSYYQKNKRLGFTQDLDSVAAYALADGQENNQDVAAEENISPETLLSMIQELPDGYRMVLNLYVFEEYTHKEIGEMLGIAENTSKSQLSKARRTLRRKLNEHMAEKQVS